MPLKDSPKGGSISSIVMVAYIMDTSCRQKGRATAHWRSLASRTWRNTRDIEAVSASIRSSLTLIAFETRVAASADTIEASCDPCLRTSRERSLGSLRKFQLPHDSLEARLCAQGIHEGVGF